MSFPEHFRTFFLQNAERTEEFKVKMVTSDDEQTTDIVVQGGWRRAG